VKKTSANPAAGAVDVPAAGGGAATAEAEAGATAAADGIEDKKRLPRRKGFGSLFFKMMLCSFYRARHIVPNEPLRHRVTFF
jgi:hypothetical protein